MLIKQEKQVLALEGSAGDDAEGARVGLCRLQVLPHRDVAPAGGPPPSAAANCHHHHHHHHPSQAAI